MTLFVYEACTARGWGADPAAPAHAMFLEGRAMRDALAADLAAVPGVTVVMLEGGPGHDARFAELAARSTATAVIAPELGGHLEALTEAARRAGGRVLAGTAGATALAADKLRLAGHWLGAAVPTPRTWPASAEPPAGVHFPLIVKPRSGAGSTATIRLDAPAGLAHIRAEGQFDGVPLAELIAQEFHPGEPASVAFVVPEAGEPLALLPCRQTLSADGRFRYLGGELPLPPALPARAERLARRAVDALPGLAGTVGVDLLLGDAADGSRDVAIEVNARLTTSYLGLRAAADFNLAQALLAAFGLAPTPRAGWKPGRVRFTATSVERGGSQEPEA